MGVFVLYRGPDWLRKDLHYNWGSQSLCGQGDYPTNSFVHLQVLPGGVCVCVCVRCVCVCVCVICTYSLLCPYFQSPEKIFSVHVSYLEIYNEHGYDLLDPRHEASKLEDLP